MPYIDATFTAAKLQQTNRHTLGSFNGAKLQYSSNVRTVVTPHMNTISLTPPDHHSF